MNKCLVLLVLIGLCGCVGDGRKRIVSNSDSPPEEKPDQNGEIELDEEHCLPIMDWQEAIMGQGNSRILAKILTRPEDPEVQRIVQKASQGTANCKPS